jgi:ElaB/YqjD/DUF883 family membrane-anchored ribosome-binding protein
VTTPEPVLPASRQPMPGSDPPAAADGSASARPSRARTPDEIERDLAAIRERLASTVDELTDRVSPRSIARRTIERVRARVLDDQGRPRPEAIGAAAGVVVVVGLLAWRSRRKS